MVAALEQAMGLPEGGLLDDREYDGVEGTPITNDTPRPFVVHPIPNAPRKPPGVAAIERPYLP